MQWKDMRLPPHVPKFARGFSGQIPVRFDGAPGGPLEGRGMWRGVKDFEHGTLCAAFNLDPVRFYFDLPSTVRGIGPNMSGVAGGHRHGQRRINGFVMMHGRSEPVAKISVVFEAERFRDVDPLDQREFFDLGRS